MLKSQMEKGSIMAMTLIVTLILSMLGLAMLPLSVIEYRSAQNFLDFEKAYFLAEAGLEEAISELDDDWHHYHGSTWRTFHDGEYKIQVEGTGSSRIVTAVGRIGNIQREIQAKIEKAAAFTNLAELTDYAIFTQGDLSLEELGDITSIGDKKGIIGVRGDFSFKSAENSGEVYLKAEGDVSIEQPHKAPNYPGNFPPPPKELINLSGFNMGAYIQWLKANFMDKITLFKAGAGQKKYSYHGGGGDDDCILIFEDYTQELTLKGTINGLMIIKNTTTLKVSNDTEINGMIIFDGRDIAMTEFQIAGSKVKIYGGLICTKPSLRKGNWQVELYHDADVLTANLGNYLPENFEGNTEEDLPLHVLYWKEIHE